jgi:hypothetical protein
MTTFTRQPRNDDGGIHFARYAFPHIGVDLILHTPKIERDARALGNSNVPRVLLMTGFFEDAYR